MEKLFNVAYTICDISGWALPIYELQRMMYITQLFHLGHYDEPLFNGHFEAWEYGPIEPILYDRVRGFGLHPIPHWSLDQFKTVTDRKNSNFIESMTNALNYKTRRGLLNFVIEDIGAWKRLYKKGDKHIAISNEEMKEEYKRRFPVKNNKYRKKRNEENIRVSLRETLNKTANKEQSI